MEDKAIEINESISIKQTQKSLSEIGNNIYHKLNKVSNVQDFKIQIIDYFEDIHKILPAEYYGPGQTASLIEFVSTINKTINESLIQKQYKLIQKNYKLKKQLKQVQEEKMTNQREVKKLKKAVIAKNMQQQRLQQEIIDLQENLNKKQEQVIEASKNTKLQNKCW